MVAGGVDFVDGVDLVDFTGSGSGLQREFFPHIRVGFYVYSPLGSFPCPQALV